MNYLAHAYLAGTDPVAIVGNLLGDAVKGAPEALFSPALCRGIRLHRAVDSFADAHPAFRRSRRRLRPHLDKLAPVAVDVVYDHFLARHWHRFSDEPLDDFAQRVYAALVAYRRLLPPRFGRFAQAMRERDLLVGYAELTVTAEALRRIGDRVRGGARLGAAGTALREHYADLEADFLAFFPAVCRFALDGDIQQAEDADDDQVDRYDVVEQPRPNEDQDTGD